MLGKDSYKNNTYVYTYNTKKKPKSIRIMKYRPPTTDINNIGGAGKRFISKEFNRFF